ncbi:hypothetical protein BJ170DRAFT_593516 [Xylariales sp. AK1849]|nr:hypothetical protein BJ170DRAFT_593516 [Xylariales sp. AK1849]
MDSSNNQTEKQGREAQTTAAVTPPRSIADRLRASLVAIRNRLELSHIVKLADTASDAYREAVIQYMVDENRDKAQWLDHFFMTTGSDQGRKVDATKGLIECREAFAKRDLKKCREMVEKVEWVTEHLLGAKAEDIRITAERELHVLKNQIWPKLKRAEELMRLSEPRSFCLHWGSNLEAFYSVLQVGHQRKPTNGHRIQTVEIGWEDFVFIPFI